MKAIVKKVERNRDVFKQQLDILLVVEVDEREFTDMSKAENALRLLNDANLPLDIHFISNELVRSMSTEDLERLFNDIVFELDEREDRTPP